MRARSGLLFSLVVLIAADLIAAEYGPRTFTRGLGAPQRFTERFERRIVAEQYELVIDADGISSASVWLNGEPIAGPSDFSQTKNSVRRSVALRDGTNEISVQLASGPGGTLTIRIAAVLGASGGTIAAPGATLTIPAGALQSGAEIDLRAIAAEDVGAPVPFGFLGAVQLDLDATLAAAGELALAFDGAIAGRALVARVVPGDTRFALVDLATAADRQLQTAVSPFAGVRSGGTYVFVDMPAALGIAGIRAVTSEGDPAPGTMVQALAENAAAFVGIADDTGLAAIPGVAPESEVPILAITSGDGAAGAIRTLAAGMTTLDVATIALPDLPDIIADGFLPAWLQNVVIRGYWSVDPNTLPAAPPACPCLLLQVRPSSIAFAPGDTAQLSAECDQSDVTNKWLDIPLLLQGLQSQLTWYGGYDATAIAVSRDGLVTALAPGQTDIWVTTATVQLCVTIDPTTGQRVVAPFQCWAAGGVHPVTVSCPSAAPHWNAAQSRCEAHFVVQTTGVGTGTVSLAPPLIPPCRGTCNGAGTPGASTIATATSDPGSDFAGWSGACSGSAATSSFIIQEGAVCTAQFIVQNRQLTITKQGQGDGVVSTAPGGIYCDEPCLSANAPYPGGSTVTLTAAPGFASKFVSWSGACAGTSATTSVTMSGDKTCTANFDPILKMCSGAVHVAQYHLYDPTNPNATADGDLWGLVEQARYGRYFTTDVRIYNGDATSLSYPVGGTTDVVWSPQPVPQSLWPVFWKNLQLVAARFDQPMTSATVTFRYLSRGSYWQPTHLTVSVPTNCFP